MSETIAGMNGKADVGSSSRNPSKSMSVQLFGISDSPFVLLFIPNSCSYQPQTPNSVLFCDFRLHYASADEFYTVQTKYEHRANESHNQCGRNFKVTQANWRTWRPRDAQ